MTLSETAQEIKLGVRPYIATVDGGSASIEEFRNGAWRAALTLSDGVTSEPTIFQGKRIRVTGSGEFEIKKVTF